MNIELAEYAYSRKVSEKVDVYSFGIVLLELTTGRKAHDGGDDGSLADWARHHSDGKQLFEALDEDIKDPAYMQEIETVFKLGIMCTAALPSRRPTMKGVLQGLLQFDQMVAVCDQIQTNLSVQCESSK